MKLKCVETYEELYRHEPFDVAFGPYLISPLGAHIDHQNMAPGVRHQW